MVSPATTRCESTRGEFKGNRTLQDVEGLVEVIKPVETARGAIPEVGARRSVLALAWHGSSKARDRFAVQDPRGHNGVRHQICGGRPDPD